MMMMLGKFEKAILDLYGNEYAYAVDCCISDTFATFGEPITLNDLFTIWGQMCEELEDLKNVK